MAEPVVESATGRPRLVSRFVRGFRPLWLAPLLAVLALGAWALASPLGASPDDDFHLASIWCAQSSPESTCAVDPETGQRSVPVALIRAPCFAHQPNETAACQTPFFADPAVRAFTDRGNFFNNYPPVYYATMGIFASDNYLVSALVMRLINVLLFVGITTVLFLLLPLRRRATLLWAWIITLVPLGLFLVASNNPSSWAITGVGSAWLALLGYFETTGRRRVGLGVAFVVAALMAAGARGDAAIYIVLSIGIVAVLTFRPERTWWRRFILPAVVGVGAVLFYLGSQQSGVAVGGLGTGQSGSTDAAGALGSFALLAYNVLYVPSLWSGIFTGSGWTLGWFDTEMPAIVFFAASFVFAGVVFAGLRRTRWRKTLAVVGLILVLWLLPVYVLVAGHNAVGENVQPRYLLPLFVVLAGVATLAVRASGLRISVAQAVLVAVALSGAQAVALHSNLRRYVMGSDVAGFNLDERIEWWWDLPISPMGVWVIGTLAFAALMAILLKAIASPHVTR
ncbi:MAG: DUF2142 domain-containing protein [Salinibacterium sp.]|nr:DUF2142 domain-containing protein [Salinibacterium sp.]